MTSPPKNAKGLNRCCRLRSSGGFTLLEVVLAVVIAVGMLMVVLFFYQQAADLRTQLLQETEHLSVARLVMDRITGELRTARRHSYFQGAFIGEADFIQFIKTDIPSRAAWKGGASGRATLVETDLKLVSYRLGTSQGTNVLGFGRTEEVLVDAIQPVGSQESGSEKASSPKLLTDMIRFASFRYWDGRSWQSSWAGSELPQGIELSLGLEPLPSGTEPLEYPYEVFRRVICLPGSSLKTERRIQSVALAEVER